MLWTPDGTQRSALLQRAGGRSWTARAGEPARLCCAHPRIHRSAYLIRYVLADKPDRGLLRHVIFPALLEDHSNRTVLFVGCEIYTVPYLWRLRGRALYTIDPAPERRWYGARHRHFVDGVENLGRHVHHELFDVVILNGVLNFGLDTPERADTAVRAVAAAMRTDALLLIGWNPVDQGITTDDLPSLRELFRPAVLEPLPGPRYSTLGSREHIFETHRRLPAGPAPAGTT